METFLINFVIGIIIFGGFFLYWGRASGWFKEGGLVYKWWEKKRNKIRNKKNSKK